MIASREPKRSFLGGTSASDNDCHRLYAGDLMYFLGVFRREGSVGAQVDAIVNWNH